MVPVVFIGTLWSVSDSIALEFTKEFYSQIANGNSIGDSVRLARLKCKKPGDVSWLAYVLYGSNKYDDHFLFLGS